MEVRDGQPCANPVTLTSMSEILTQPKSFLSSKVAHFTESVIREMTRQAMQYGAVNLAQGFPDFTKTTGRIRSFQAQSRVS